MDDKSIISYRHNEKQQFQVQKQKFSDYKVGLGLRDFQAIWLPICAEKVTGLDRTLVLSCPAVHSGQYLEIETKSWKGSLESSRPNP